MAVRIRLRRMGAKKQPFYRVVVADSRSPRDGRFLDTIGTYNPRSEPVDIRIDREKALQWLAEGAEPTDSARSLLSKAGIWQEFKTGERPEEKPRPTPATPAERTAPEPETVEAPEEVETEIDREMAVAGESEETAAEGPPVATAEEEVAEAGEEAAEAVLEGVETEEAEEAGEGEAPAEEEEK